MQSVETPYTLLGGAEPVRRIVETFYDTMDEREPALAALHRRDEDGRIAQNVRDRFGSFLIGWLGGPDDYVQANGHPRLRLRHGKVPVDEAMRDAWLRCMAAALDAEGVQGPVRRFLDQRFAEVADFLRNA